MSSKGQAKDRKVTRRITLSGAPGSGKSTAGAILAKRMRLQYFSAGEIFRGLAKENEFSLEALGRMAEKDWDIDRYLDNQMLEKIRGNESGIFEGRLTGYLTYMNDIPAIRMYLSCPIDIRVRRVMKRENKDRKTVEKEITDRQRSERKRYKQIYGFDIEDMSIYHIVIDSSKRTPEEIVDEICRKLQ
jgi:predicted cytidylate kinase